MLRSRALPLLALVAVGGCSAAAGAPVPHDSATPRVTATPAIRSAHELRLPLDSYALTAEEDGLVSRAFSTLVADCAKRFDVETSIPAPKNASAVEMNIRRYGLVEGSPVEKYGYGLPPKTRTAADDKGDWNPTPQEDLALRGSADAATQPRDHHGAPLPVGGCLGETQRKLGGDPPLSPGAASLDSFKASENDPRVVKAMSAWAACMKTAGFSYTNPWQPNDEAWPEPAGANEIRTAQQDVACRQRSNLVGTWLAVESAYQERLIAQHSGQFDALEKWRDRRVSVARETLGL
ncbi:hypothetical protein SAMN05216199_1044 [Pedococcus cremeus]|uniref:Lipoprotein n=1 Tax=Pedococcus cremeus TaxID=587636 RepID=A0A1H9RMR9_9MICO|nr:hypothetical protein [Pedococcus cremeus]SER73907.1 hypothetical protein SAMN05216199_1044 [Pedococcus cremeus]